MQISVFCNGRFACERSVKAAGALKQRKPGSQVPLKFQQPPDTSVCSLFVRLLYMVVVCYHCLCVLLGVAFAGRVWHAAVWPPALSWLRYYPICFLDIRGF